MIYRENMKTACFAVYDERDLTCLYIYLMINPKKEDENFLQMRVVYRTKYRTKKEKQKYKNTQTMLTKRFFQCKKLNIFLKRYGQYTGQVV